jgi:hypothetical protein
LKPRSRYAGSCSLPGLEGGGAAGTRRCILRSEMVRRHKNSECICGCGDIPALPRSRFLPGHDAKAASKIKSAVDEGRVSELSSELRYYGMERGFIEQR